MPQALIPSSLSPGIQLILYPGSAAGSGGGPAAERFGKVHLAYLASARRLHPARGGPGE